MTWVGGQSLLVECLSRKILGEYSDHVKMLSIEGIHDKDDCSIECFVMVKRLEFECARLTVNGTDLPDQGRHLLQ